LADRTPISLVIDTDYECSRPRAVTSVINRYYDPTTDQFLSIDPVVAQTDQPYVFTNDDPLNAEDPLGLGNKQAKLRLVTKAYSVPVGVLGEIIVKNVVGKLEIATPTSTTMVSLELNNLNGNVKTYPNGISGFKPLYLAPTGNVFSTKVDGEPESNFVVYASVFGGNPAPGEWDPGPEEIIEPTPAISALSYRESVTFEVAYLTPAR
jgi:RHS repeat-associated protein